ncbi:hypothetical protein VCV18_006356 [Metarhizium anisopliae]
MCGGRGDGGGSGEGVQRTSLAAGGVRKSTSGSAQVPGLPSDRSRRIAAGSHNCDQVKRG